MQTLLCQDVAYVLKRHTSIHAVTVIKKFVTPAKMPIVIL